jgi:hypothetical protein
LVFILSGCRALLYAQLLLMFGRASTVISDVTLAKFDRCVVIDVLFLHPPHQ